MNKPKLEDLSTKLAELKLTLNEYSDNLSLEQYDHLHGDIEALQCLVLDCYGSDSGISYDENDYGVGIS